MDFRKETIQNLDLVLYSANTNMAFLQLLQTQTFKWPFAASFVLVQTQWLFLTAVAVGLTACSVIVCLSCWKGSWCDPGRDTLHRLVDRGPWMQGNAQRSTTTGQRRKGVPDTCRGLDGWRRGATTCYSCHRQRIKRVRTYVLLLFKNIPN